MSWVGDFALGKTFDIKFTTVNTSGVPTTLAGTPVVSAYPDNSTTEITAGITLTVDFDARTGMHNVRVVATSGNGYAAGSNYQLVITTGTVGGSSVVGYVIGQFSIEARSALRPTTIDRTLDVSLGGEAGLDWANIGSPTTAQNLSATNIDADQVVASVSGAVGSVTGAVGSVAAGGITAASIADAAIDRATFAVDTGLQTIRSNTAQAGAAGTITLDASASAADDFYNDAWVYITGGAGVGQSHQISDYVGTTKVASVSPNWITNPDATSTFAILPFGRVDLGQWAGALANALIAGRVDSNTQAMAADVITSTTIATDAIGSAEFAQAAADKVWSTAARALTDKAGFALSAAGIQAIWDALTSALTTAGSIGKLLVDNINATISSRSSHSAADVWTSATRTLTGIASGIIAAAELNNIADALLKRDMSLVSGEAARSPLNALRAIRNKASIAATTLTVTKEDDTTTAWTAALTVDAAASHITGIDPA